MKTLLLIGILALIINCSSGTAAQNSVNGSNGASGENQKINNEDNSANYPKVENITALSAEESAKIDEMKLEEIKAREEKLKNVPDAFGKIDFGNFSYPKIAHYRGFTLKNGGLVLEGGRWTFNLENVDYSDFDNDGEPNALVKIREYAVGGSSSTSYRFYLFSSKNNKPFLIWKLSTGDDAVCAFKESKIENREFIVEVFGKCEIEDDRLNDKNAVAAGGKDYFTRFVFGITESGFRQASREVLSSQAAK